MEVVQIPMDKWVKAQKRFDYEVESQAKEFAKEMIDIKDSMINELIVENQLLKNENANLRNTLDEARKMMRGMKNGKSMGRSWTNQ